MNHSIQAASTLVLLRNAADGLEVLLVQRPYAVNDASSGAFVFPGGKLDTADGEFDAALLNLDAAQASAQLSVSGRTGLDYFVAAVRECAEETGLLLVVDADGQPVSDAVYDGSPLEALCRRHGWRLDVASLAYHSHWLTPVGMPRRFDTRFFVAAVPSGCTVVCRTGEVVEHRWVRAAAALEVDSGFKLPHPTRRTLQSLVRFASVQDCLDAVRSLRDIRRILPRLAGGAAGRRPVMPDEPPYAEIGLVDPDGQGQAAYEIVPGRRVRLSAHVWRLTAPNASAMTGPGTNAYFVGTEGGDCALIDPGPDDPVHVQALLDQAPGRVTMVLVTHSHRDHSPAAATIAARTGSPVLGRLASHRESHDASFSPARELQHGERLRFGPGATLRVLHTPGHASNHLCFLLEEQKLLFTGDHVMQGSSVVINPPDGNMQAYVASLQALLEEDLDWLAPGHGFLIDKPADALRLRIRHRLAREAKVLRVLERAADATLDSLLPGVYDDVPARMHPVARRSLLAHLEKLREEGRARLHDEQWRAIPTKHKECVR